MSFLSEFDSCWSQLQMASKEFSDIIFFNYCNLGICVVQIALNFYGVLMAELDGNQDNLVCLNSIIQYVYVVALIAWCHFRFTDNPSFAKFIDHQKEI